MKIKLTWRKYFFTQLRRNFLAINCSQKHWEKLKADHALEWGNDLDNVWYSFFDEVGDSTSPTLIPIIGGKINVWKSYNKKRRNPFKISQKIWDVETDRISIWFRKNLILTKQIMDAYKTKKILDKNEFAFHKFLEDSINNLSNLNNKGYFAEKSWMNREINNMKNLVIDMNWFFDKNHLLKELSDKYLENYYLIIIQFISEGNKFYYTDLVSDSFMDKTIKNNLENKSSSFGVININNENLKNRFLKIFNDKYDAEAYTTENNNTKTLLNSFVPPSFNPIQKSFGKPYATIQVQREEQSYFKKLYFGSNKQIKCYICKNEFNREFVWLSHLKKRSHCSNEERYDYYVFMPMCLFGCDKLYEEGYIFINKNGIIDNLIK